MHGEYTDVQELATYGLGSPPYARGIHTKQDDLLTDIRITPVCTGNTENYNLFLDMTRDHPRMHGEYNIVIWVLA
mgnify:CR=1 FL=1